jgi:hypothetical protein
MRIDTWRAWGRLDVARADDTGMNETEQSLDTSANDASQRRLKLAREAFRQFYAQRFWSYREDAEITEEKILFVIRGLREHGGLAGYKVAAELCH